MYASKVFQLIGLSTSTSSALTRRPVCGMAWAACKPKRGRWPIVISPVKLGSSFLTIRHHIRMQRPAHLLFFPIPPYWPKQRPVHVLTMFGHCQGVPNALCHLWVDSERPFLTTLAHYAQCVIPSVDVEVSDFQSSDLVSEQDV